MERTNPSWLYKSIDTRLWPLVGVDSDHTSDLSRGSRGGWRPAGAGLGLGITIATRSGVISVS